MVTRTTTYDYEQSSESGRERNVLFPWSRLTDTTPALGDPAQVTGLPVGTQVTGTVINPGVVTTDEYAVLNVAKGAVYRHNVRNCTDMNAGPVENTFRAINVGDTVYYAPEQDTINGVKLSLSPLAVNGAAHAVFGHVVLMQDEDSSDYPKGTGSAGSTHVCAIEQD